MADVTLSTIDNPIDPFKDFNAWLAYDQELAFRQQRPTCLGYLARFGMFSTDTSDAEIDEVYEMAVDEACKLNLSGTFYKAVKGQQNPPTSVILVEEKQEAPETTENP